MRLTQLMLVAGIITLFAIASCYAQETAAPDLIWRFDTDGDLEGWTPANFASVEVSDGMLRGVTDYDSMLTSPELDLDANDYSIVEFRVSSSLTGGGEIFFHQEGNSFAPERQQRHVVVASDEPRVYRSRVADLPTWQGVIKRIRLDILNPEGAEIALDYIRITSESRGIIDNAGFENDFDEDNLPDGWAINAAEAKWSSENALQGDRSLMLATDGDQRTATATARAQIDRTGIYQLAAAIARLEGRADHAVDVRFLDVFERPIPGSDVSLTKTTREEQGVRHIASELDAPPLAAWADVTLSVEAGAARAWWDAVELVHVVETPDVCLGPMEDWRARWIWAKATRGLNDAPAYFRYSFELPVEPDRLTDARLQITADDMYTLWLNGTQISASTDADGWRTPEMVDLQPHLVRGRNVFAVEARDVSSAEGLIAEGAIKWGRDSLTLLSGGDWKAGGEVSEGWQEPAFDDAEWPSAVVVATAGSAPWGPLPYEFLGSRELVRLIRADIPAEVTADGEMTISALVSHLPETADETDLRLSLRTDSSEPLCWSWPTEAVTRKTEEGVEIGPLTVSLSSYLPAANYHVVMGYPRMQYVGQDDARIGAVHVRPAATAERRPDVRIAEHGGLPTLFINDAPHPFMHYQELRVGRDRIRNMASADVHLYFLEAENIGWTGPGTFDYSAWDAKVIELLLLDPKALILPSYTVSGRHQQWWLEAHPEELARTEDGGTSVGIYHHGGEAISLASERWRQEAGDALRRFIGHCNAAPYSSRIIGYLTASGVSYEWQHWGSVGDFPPTDYSEPMQEAFREWLRGRYASDEALQEAWRMPEVTFDTVAIPSVEQRDAADHMLFRDPSNGRYEIDFYLFYQDVMADGILHYFGIVKDATGGEALAGTYYGYVVTMLGGARRAGDAGHMALSNVIESDLCDFLLSPWDYSLREVGNTMGIMTATGSVLAHGKLWGMESDLRTHLVTDPNQRRHGAPDHLDGTVSQLRRVFASAATKGLAVRWYDFSNGWIADDPRQAQVIGQLRDIADRWVEWDRSPDPNGIAVVVDEDTPAAYLSHQIQAMFWLVYRQKSVFDRVGVPWNIYLLDDVVAGRVPKMRAYFFLNCFQMTDAERTYIDAELKSDGRSLVWFYAPGYIEDDLDVSRISELTGMEFSEIEEMRTWESQLEPEHPWAEGITHGSYSQPRIEIGPVFVPQEEGLEVVGRWSDGGEPGLAVRRFDDWTSVYTAGPILSPLLLKRICEDAGAYVPVEGTEPAYVSRNMIGLHSAVARTERLRFDRPTRVVDLLTDEILAAACTELEVQVPGPGTLLLRTRPAY